MSSRRTAGRSVRIAAEILARMDDEYGHVRIRCRDRAVAFWYVRDYLGLPADTVRTVVFLKLLVAGHMTIYITRCAGTPWRRPWPSWRLVVTAEATQIAGSLAAVHGWFVAPLGWTYALAVWGYAAAWFVLNSLAKLAVDRLREHGHAPHARHLMRVHAPLQPFGTQRVRGDRLAG